MDDRLERIERVLDNVKRALSGEPLVAIPKTHVLIERVRLDLLNAIAAEAAKLDLTLAPALRAHLENLKR
jgi:hypothetical protein